MIAQYRCENEARHALVRDHPVLNGIDYLEVLDTDAIPLGSPRQRTLLLHCLKTAPALTAVNVRIDGGVRINTVGVLWAFPAPAVPATVASVQERAFFSGLPDAARVLVVRTNSGGDFSTYRLSLVRSSLDPAPPPNFDTQLSAVPFSFKVECPSDFDCRTVDTCRPALGPEPQIDYLAKDYASFRRVMLDRLSLILPEWTERNPADLGVALVEILAYAGDSLSYYQDAVGTEAYLGTALKRISVRRHARLLDYPMHDGSNARAWVTVQMGPAADGLTLAAPAMLLTKGSEPRGALRSERLSVALREGAHVFETLHDVILHEAHNEIRFHTWGDDRCCLPSGATRATLLNNSDRLQNLSAGDVLIFEEIRGPQSGEAADADHAHRHAVRLSRVEFTTDGLFEEAPGQPLRVANVEWAPQDALPFPLCLWEQGGRPVSIARGNVVLADHGRTIANEPLADVPSRGRYLPKLKFGPVTRVGSVRDKRGKLVRFDPRAPAAAALRWELRDTSPAISLREDGRADQTWTARRDLLNSDRFARDFVVETDDDGRAHLRFGDGVLGRRPAAGATLAATYRVGNGPSGNVGPEAIAHVVTSQAGILDVRNPLPATGGVAPEPMEQVRLYAPQAFRTQERAVTEADYAAVAQRHPDVQRAAATVRWTGSWYTVFVTVDRKGGRPVNPAFRNELRSLLDHFRMAGYDLEIESPVFVALDIGLSVCLAAGYLPGQVKAALLEVFSSGELPGGKRGFFHPDNFTFGQPVHLSQVVAAAMRVPGVLWVDTENKAPNRFQRWGQGGRSVPADGFLTLGRLEIARLDNDPNAPENGKIEFFLRGGE